jgi:CubicO group peptidase (beta-lactamase class C family)
MKPVTSLIWAISILLCICAGGWASSVNVHVSSPDEKPGTGFSKDSSCHQYDSPGGFSSLSKAEVDGIIEPYIKNGTFVGVAVAVIDEHGYDVWGYGTTDSNSTHVPDENTVCEIGSVSKTFSGVLLADALLQGTMTLTDPLSRYLPQDQKVPDFEGRTITIRDLATHTSGLPPVPDKFFIVANNSSNKSLLNRMKTLFPCMRRWMQIGCIAGLEITRSLHRLGKTGVTAMSGRQYSDRSSLILMA